MRRERPRIDNPDVSGIRYAMYKQAWNRYNEAYKAKYFIECIALVESLIADRMESLANEISSSSKFSYSTLEKLTEYLSGKKQTPMLTESIIQIIGKIVAWKDGRNKAIHEMAKLSEGLNETFEQKYGELSQISDTGRELFNELNNEIRKFRKANKSD